MPNLTNIGSTLVAKSLPKPALRILTPHIIHAAEGLSSRAIADELKRRGVSVSHTTIAEIVRRFQKSYDANRYFWHRLEEMLGVAETLAAVLGMSIDEVLHEDRSMRDKLGACRASGQIKTSFEAARDTYQSFWLTLDQSTKRGVLSVWSEITGGSRPR